MSLSSLFKAGMAHSSAPTVASILVATPILAIGTYSVLTATEVVAGATAAPGAISTTSTLVGGETMVFSVVKASLAHKLLLGGLFVAGAAYAGYLAYGYVKEQQEIINSIKQ